MGTIPKIYDHWIFIALFILLAGCQAKFDLAQLTAKQAYGVVEENRHNKDFVILDIRTPKEYAQGHIAGAVLLDYYSPKYLEGLNRLDKSKSYLFYCRSGNRTGRTLMVLEQMGFRKIYHLQRGIIEWQANKYKLVR